MVQMAGWEVWSVSSSYKRPNSGIRSKTGAEGTAVPSSHFASVPSQLIQGATFEHIITLVTSY